VTRGTYYAIVDGSTYETYPGDYLYCAGSGKLQKPSIPSVNTNGGYQITVYTDTLQFVSTTRRAIYVPGVTRATPVLATQKRETVALNGDTIRFSATAITDSIIVMAVGAGGGNLAVTDSCNVTAFLNKKLVPLTNYVVAVARDNIRSGQAAKKALVEIGR
jgi:hypothetical protein